MLDAVFSAEKLSRIGGLFPQLQRWLHTVNKQGIWRGGLSSEGPGIYTPLCQIRFHNFIRGAIVGSSSDGCRETRTSHHVNSSPFVASLVRGQYLTVVVRPLGRSDMSSPPSCFKSTTEYSCQPHHRCSSSLVNTTISHQKFRYL